MFASIMIIIIVLTNFLTLVYAKERLEDSDITTMMMKEAGILVNDKMFKSVIKGLFRLILTFVIFVFWMHSLIFISFLRLSIILNIIVGIISIIIFAKMYKNPNLFETFTKRLWITRISAILSLAIWFPHFLPLLTMVF